MILLIIVLILCALICYFVAKMRHADTVYWIILGLALGPFAIPFVFFSKSKADIE